MCLPTDPIVLIKLLSESSEAEFALDDVKSLVARLTKHSK